ncbi:MAG: DUF4242 domain-containing protein [Ignavibacteriales bacterium]|nr:MAG: DUF4242 domain-containing protein [Ignavibacteriales bacterium]
MAKLKKYMAVHKDPKISWKKVEENWAISANIDVATWLRTYFNKNEGVRYCVWLSPDAKKLKSVFKNLGVTFESLMEVEETVPDLWGDKWKKHLVADSKSATLGF